MVDDPAGKAVLKELEIDRFVVVDDSIYNSVRGMEAQVGPLELK